MRVRKKIIFMLFIIFISIVSFGLINNISSGGKNDKVDKILESSEYSYLPKQAKKYIKEVYEKSGNILLTEKNKKSGRPYLNPDYINYLIMDENDKNEESVIPSSTIIDYVKTDKTSETSVPTSYDLRNVNGKNYITPVRDQGSLGLCWAFASAGTAESNLLKTNNESFSNNSTLLSERQIDYATSIDGIKDYKNEYVSFVNRNLGSGGNFYISTVAMANGISLYKYNSFKSYNDKDLEQMELKDVLSYSKSLYEVDSTINMPQMNIRKSTGNPTEKELETRESFINDVKSNIIEYGSAYVSTKLGMNNRCMFKDDNNNYIIDKYNCGNESGHAMQIIGWDDDYEYKYCADTYIHEANISKCNNVVSGNGVWILKNSWGEENKYPYLVYDSLDTQISFIKNMKSTQEKVWDNNYILGEGASNVVSKEYSLANTKIKGEEKLEKIKFIINSSDGNFFIIKILDANGNYVNGSKYIIEPGLVTLEYENGVSINKDSKILIEAKDKKHEFIDKVMIFTSNIDNDSYISLEKYDNISISDKEFRLYSDTKNIPSGSLIEYKFYNEQENDVTSNVVYSNNEVSENNVNTLLKFNTLPRGKYKIDAIYNGNVLKTITINYEKMKGNGTENDPYIITNSTQLDQIRDDLDAYYALGNNIDLTDDTRQGGRFCNKSSYEDECFGWIPIEDFEGSLDGKGYAIIGLYEKTYLKSSYRTNSNGGLFGNIKGNIDIKNLVLEDFDISCHGICGALASKYENSKSKINYSETAELNINNIVIKNGNIRGIQGGRTAYASGLISSVINDGNFTNIKNIYIDSNVESKNYVSGLINYFKSLNGNIENIEILGNIEGEYSVGLINDIRGIYGSNDITDKIKIKNIIMTTDNKDMCALLIKSSSSNDLNITNVALLKNTDVNFIASNSNSVMNNVNSYDINNEFSKMSDKNTYSSWEDFEKNFVIKTVDGVPRIPILKFVDFKYTNIEDITIKQKLNEHKKIYDYIKPNTVSAKRISYKSNDESIVKIDKNGIIIPQSTGKTTIHIESYYDGYIKDVPITIEYKPHYVVHFDSNSDNLSGKGSYDIEGTMESIEFSTEKSSKLPENKFTHMFYEFKEWNTKADGTGTSYTNLDTIPAMKDKEEITLYAQWIGKEYEITFDPNGGITPIKSKLVRYREVYGELPIPTKKGSGFSRWKICENCKTPDAYESVYAPFYKVLTATWVNDAYTIIYDANGGTVLKDYDSISGVNLVSDSLATTFARNNQDDTISKNIYEKFGYKFKEWNTKADGTGTSYMTDQTINLSNVEDDTLRLYAIWEEEYSYIIDKYTVDEENKYIDFIDINTSISEFMKNIRLNVGYTIEVDYKTVNDISVLYTGGKTIIFKNNVLYKEYINIIRGDVNGDGKINYLDYVSLYNHIQKVKNSNLNKKQLKGVYLISADINNDSKINYLDYVKAYNKIKELKGDIN